MKISFKLTLILLFAVLLPSLIITYINFYYSGKIITDAVEENLNTGVKQRIDYSNKYAKHIVKSITILSKNPVLINALETNDIKQVDNIFGYTLEEHMLYDMFLISKSGKIVFTIKKEKDLNKNLNEKPFIGGKFSNTYQESIKTNSTAISNFYYYSPSKRYAAFIVVPIFENTERIGSLAVQLNIDSFFELANDYGGLGKTGEIILAQKSGDKAVFINKLRYDDKPIFTRFVKIGSNIGKPIQEAVQGKYGSGIYDDYENIKVIASWGYIDSFKIGMVIKIDTDEAYSKLENLKKLNIIIGIIILFVILYVIRHIDKIVTVLEETRNQYELAISGTHDGLWDWNLITNDIYFSPRAKEMLGYKDYEMSSNIEEWEDKVHKDDLNYVVKFIQECHTNPSKEYNIKYRVRHKDGHYIWLLDRGKTFYDKNNKPIRMVGFHTDITKLKTQEIKIKELSTLLNNTINSVNNLIFVKDKEFKYILCNKHFEDFIGLSKEDIIGKTDYDFFDKETADFFRQKDKEMFNLGTINSNFEWVKYPDGRDVYLYTSKAPLYDEDKNSLGLVGNSVDMTHNKKLEDELQDSKKQFEQFMEFMPANIIIKENDIVVYANSRTNKLFHRDSIVGESVDTLFTKDKAQKIKELENKAYENGFHEEISINKDYNDNKEIVYRNMAFVIDNEQSKKLGIVSINITKEYLANREISRVLSAFERSDISVIITDLYGDIQYVNPRWCNVTGYSREELIGQNPRIVKSGDIPDKTYKKMWDELTSGNVWHSELKNKKKDGTGFWEDSTIMPSFNNEGQVDGYIAFKLEISNTIRLRKELKDKEEIMIAQSRHAAMGEMISMIAHQWRQPISVIAMDANNILVDIELDILDKNELYNASKDIIIQTQELSRTIDDFREFFKPNRNTEYTLFEQVISDALNVIGKSLENNNINVVLNIDKSIKIKTFSRELMQVVINIIKNSKEALLENDIDEKEISISLHKNNEQINLSICDNGVGIEKNIIDKIFQPYFTTKGDKNGTGLGLYMSKTIVDKHLKGSIRALNLKNGVCFEIILPFKLDNEGEVDISG